MAKESNKKNLNPDKKEEVLCAALKKFGFLFPMNEHEVEEFKRNYGNTKFPLPPELEDFQSILDSQANHKSEKSQPADVPLIKASSKRSKKKGSSELKDAAKNVDYYRRTVLAAEIVHELHNEAAFGHVKLQKLIFLVQKTENMAIPVNFLRQAMGPYDPVMMRSIDKQLSIKKWFVFQPDQVLKYKPLEKAGEHHKDYLRYYGHQQDQIKWLIDTFRKEKTKRVEIVATLFACWEKLIKEKAEASENNLIDAFYNWSQEKEKFNKTDVIKEISWMREINLTPKIY